jgi:glucosyl-3-phosphoglycerate phosphatase
LSADFDAVDPEPAVGPWPAGATGRLIVIRHGRTAWNELGLFQGHADVPLDAEGERQAAELAVELAPLRPDRIVSSDLTRARQTAAPLAAAVGLEPLADPRLREVDVGNWEGLTRDQVITKYPDEYQAWTSGADVTRGGSETRSSSGRRAADAIVEQVLATGSDRLLVVVSHGLVLRLAIDRLSGLGVVGIPAPVPVFANAGWLDLRADPNPA